MKINLTVEIQDPDISLDNYKTAETPVSTIEEAVEYDLDMFRAGEISLEEVIYGFGGDVEIKVSSVEGAESNQEVDQ